MRDKLFYIGAVIYIIECLGFMAYIIYNAVHY